VRGAWVREADEEVGDGANDTKWNICRWMHLFSKTRRDIDVDQ
jgi:hypothetical protein